MPRTNPHTTYFLKEKNFYWVLAAQAASIFPLFFHLPIWVATTWLVALVWRIQIQRRRWKHPNAIVKIAMAGLCVGLTYATYSGINGVEPMVGFLVCSFVLKLIEMKTSKDALIVLFIGFIAVAAQFLFAQTIFAAIVAIGSCVVLLTAWQAALRTRERSIPQHLKYGAELLIQAAPFMVLFFVFLPRLGPLWSVPFPKTAGTTGFSDSLTLGDIGELVQSPETAFRAEFEGAVPHNRDLYWRGLVLNHFDGRSWRAETLDEIQGGMREALVASSVFKYSVIMEPHDQRWLFSLGIPVSAKSNNLPIRLFDGHVLNAKNVISQKTQYDVRAVPQDIYQFQPLSEAEKAYLTFLPEGVNPKSLELVNKWRAEGKSPAQILASILELFSNEFYYTLRPGNYGRHAIDEFLFSNKRGFCEHYSSSFTFLMRAAGVPSRIVLGYQGGTMNVEEKYIQVRQSDAHAWAEVWMDGRWLRVDPTSAVSPERIEQGVAEALSEEERKLVEPGFWNSPLARALYQRWDAMGYSWNKWVLNFDDSKQKDLLSTFLGDYHPLRVGIAFMVLSVVLFLLIWFLPAFRSNKRRHLNEPERLALKVTQFFSKIGFVRSRSEPLGSFLRRLANDQHAVSDAGVKAEQLKMLAALFDRVMYAEKKSDLEHLRQNTALLLRSRKAKVKRLRALSI